MSAENDRHDGRAQPGSVGHETAQGLADQPLELRPFAGPVGEGILDGIADQPQRFFVYLVAFGTRDPPRLTI